MKTIDLIDSFKASSFYILDTTQDGLSNKIIHGSGDINYVRYCYNTHKYGKLEIGGVILYRQTKRSSKNRKFYFFGGGVIKSIVSVDKNGGVEAIIENGFKLVQPVYENNPILDSMSWTTKKKTVGSWDHFFNQYGMNKISKEEFFSIIEGTDYVHVDSDSESIVIEEMEEERVPVEKNIKAPNDCLGIYTHNKIKDEKLQVPLSTKRKNSAKKIDFNSLNAKKKNIGTFGEMLICKDEEKRTSSYPVTGKVEHVAITKGDGLGYDILSFDEKGEELLIEVKTTKSNAIDNFYLTPKEIEVAKANLNFRLYRVYDLDMVLGTYKVEVYTAEELYKAFAIIPALFVAKKKVE